MLCQFVVTIAAAPGKILRATPRAVLIVFIAYFFFGGDVALKKKTKHKQEDAASCES